MYYMGTQLVIGFLLESNVVIHSPLQVFSS